MMYYDFKLENIKLENGKFLSRIYGKYRPNLILISDVDFQTTADIPRNEQLENYFRKYVVGGCRVWKGRYRKNKKDNVIFDLTQKGDVLLSIFWSGRSDNKGFIVPKVEFLYERIASSNGGALGVTYYILKEDIKFEERYNENDF